MFNVILAILGLLVFYAIGNYLDAQSGIMDGSWASIMKLSVVTWLVWCPLMPIFFYGFNVMSNHFGETKIWIAQITLLVVNMLTAGIIFYWVNNEVPTKGTFAGVVLGVIAVLLSIFWK